MGFSIASCTDIIFDPILNKLRARDSGTVDPSITEHNLLQGLQGGDASGTIGEYYHLSECDFNLIENVCTNSSENQIIFNDGDSLVGDDTLTYVDNVLCVDGTVKVAYYTGTPQEGMIRYNPNDTMTCFEGYCNGQWVDLAGVRDVTTEHNMLSGIQGGQTGEYYHLTFDQWDTLVNDNNADSLHYHDSSAITFDAGSLTSLVSDNVEDVILELEQLIQNINTTINWGDITGDILDQTDLIDYINNLLGSLTCGDILNTSNVDTGDSIQTVCDVLDYLNNKIDNISPPVDPSTIPHNDLDGIQGGDATGTIAEHYHLTESEHDILTNDKNADDLHFHDSENIAFDVGSLADLTSDNVQDVILELLNRINNIDTDSEVACCLRKRCLAGC